MVPCSPWSFCAEAASTFVILRGAAPITVILRKVAESTLRDHFVSLIKMVKKPKTLEN
jgi:hypothetical protein